MLSDVKFCELDKASFDAQIKPLRAALAVTQQKIKRAKIPVVIVFEGWGAAGKGSLIGELIQNFDPRGFKVFTVKAATEEERRKPTLARFWSMIPEDGTIAVFDRSPRAPAPRGASPAPTAATTATTTCTATSSRR